MKEIDLLMSSWENFCFSSPETEGWIFAFLVDVTTHLNTLKRPSQVVTNDFMCPFQVKLCLWETSDKENGDLHSSDCDSRSDNCSLNYILQVWTGFQKIFPDFTVYKYVLIFNFSQIKLSQLTSIMWTKSFKWKFLSCRNVSEN